ncbi:hypothetical protein [Sediminicoccus rosea]|uniref:Uncharacterized protein n=1 Tax=Sediminicoccus rosea TaxID=1225128 RepID=A0ABZ0PNN4_9PROT|nr:hypothetical protein [Sediminicoccus rosea]WPB87170.1 hypothetical protein R9Z33_09885 [Sediminicoccus rosea]
MLAELREADAPPEVDAIYAQLRQAYGLPMVNLIWRHFATLPGVLPWAWESIAPATPLLPAATARLMAALEPLPRISMGPDAAGIAALYNRGNLSNLILLTALLRGPQRGATAPAAGPAPAGPPPAMLPKPPPLPRLEALSPEARRSVLALAGLHGHAEGIIPTLYLHLAHWPALLTPLYMALSPLFGMGRIAELRRKALEAASREADAMRPHLAAPPPPPPEALEAARAVLTPFTGQVIADMVPIGLMIGR